MIDLANIDWKNHSSRWSFILEMERYRQQTMMTLYNEWFIDIAFYAGFQDVTYDRVNKRIGRRNLPRWRRAVQNNLLLPQARTFISNMARIEPVWTVPPVSRDQDDFEIADINTSVLHHTWQAERLYREYLKALQWVATTGNGFWKVTWDPDKGDDIEVPNDDNALVQEISQLLGLDVPTGSLPSIKTGGPSVKWKNNFELIFQPGVQDIQDSLFVIDSMLRTPYYIKDKYNKEVDGRGSPNQVVTYFHEKFHRLFSRQSTYNEAAREKTMVYEVFIKPHRQLKKGMHFIMANGEDLVKPKPFPYKHGMTPYLHFGEVSVPGTMYYTSTLHQNIHAQESINTFDAIVIENARLMNAGKWLKPRQGKVRDFALTDSAGEQVEYTFPFKPEQARLSPLPRSIFDIRNILRSGMQDTASSHDPSQGKAVGSVRAASLAQELKEGDLAVLGPVQLQHDEELARGGQMILSMYEQYAREDRVISITKNGQINQVQSFNGSMLSGNKPYANYHNVQVNHIGRAPWNKIGNEQRLTSLIQGGFLRPGEHDELVLKSVGMENVDPILEGPDRARTAQNEENKRLEQGEQVKVLVTDLHTVHMMEIAKYLATPGIKERLTPQGEQALINHFNEHLKAKAVLEIMPDLVKLQTATQMRAAMGAPTNANTPA